MIKVKRIHTITSCSILFALTMLHGACTNVYDRDNRDSEKMNDNKGNPVASSEENPFFTESPLLFNYPPFDKINDSHFAPAMDKGMIAELIEIDAIVNQVEAPTFENTIVAMEKRGQFLDRASTVFFSLLSAHTNDTLNEIETEMAPKLSAHRDKILLNEKLFNRIKTLHEQRTSLNLNAESVRLIEKKYIEFVRAGADLSDADKERLKSINRQLAELSTAFSQNVLKEVNELAIIVDNRVCECV